MDWLVVFIRTDLSRHTQIQSFTRFNQTLSTSILPVQPKSIQPRPPGLANGINAESLFLCSQLQWLRLLPTFHGPASVLITPSLPLCKIAHSALAALLTAIGFY